MNSLEPASMPAATGTTIGHVHLRVADLDRSVAFYRDVLGLSVMARFPSGAAFLSVDGYHHHIALNTWDSLDGPRPPRGSTGLYHIAILYPDRLGLATAVRRLLDAGITLSGKADHGVSEAVYFDDPDGNGIELYRDRPRAEWPTDKEGRVILTNAPFDLAALLAEAGGASVQD